ncbi:phosphopantetheine-binding protein [Streptomyces sp. enrichment culture]|uniref:phosphopantetheine-binding protein n=1 Tax=Streptomyces sp. enrichment culture TaxID=1795815 RepID=UPI003F55C30D
MIGLPAVASDANLFELGADSLAIVQIAARMRGAGLPVSPGDIFAHPTPAALARRIAESAAEPPPGPASGTDATTPPATPDASAAPAAPAPSHAPGATPSADAPGHFPDADLSTEDLAQVMHLFRSGEDTQ